MIKYLTIRNLKVTVVVINIIIGLYLTYAIICRPDVIGTWWGKIVLNYEMTVKK